MKITTMIIIILAIIVIVQILNSITKKSSLPKKTTNHNYRLEKSILTQNEMNFYKSLLPIAARKGFTVCPKVNLHDILKPQKGKNQQAARNQISQKHVDFLLCNKSMVPILAIELDDNSHDRSDRKERDQFVDHAYKSAGLPILHTRDTSNLSEKIDQLIKTNKPSRAGTSAASRT